MRVQIITKDNGLGLSHDIRVLSDAILAAHPAASITVTDWQKPTPGFTCDINVFLELLNGHFLGQAKRNIFVPNPEWYLANMWGSVLPRLTEVWAKTEDCLRIFTGLHKNVVLSGWTSEDVRMPQVDRIHRMIHVAGGSSAKGTKQVIRAMRMLPDHRLCLVSKKPWPEALPQNVELMENPSDPILRGAQNACLVHLCPSSYEGFGHYINEARSCGAFIITTNAAPMNELVNLAYGAGASVVSTSRQHMATHHHVDPGSLASVIDQVMKAPASTLAMLGARARSAYEVERAAFHSFIQKRLA